MIFIMSCPVRKPIKATESTGQSVARFNMIATLVDG